VKRVTDPAWLAASYRLPLPLTRALVRDHASRQWRRLWPLALLTGGLLLLVFGSRVGLIAMPHNVRSVLWAAALLVIGLHLWLAQRAARVAILGEVKRLARESTVRAER